MKNDRYFPLEICFWAGDNLSVMMYQIGGVQLVGIYVLLLYLCAKNDYSKSVVNSMQKPVEKSAVEKNSETPMDKGQKPNETQESRVEEKYYYCCKQQQQYWRGKEDCCCCCSDFGFGECQGQRDCQPTPRSCSVHVLFLFSSRLVSARPTGEVRPPHGLQK